MDNKRRNQLIGFVILILLILFISPYIMVDKSSVQDSTIPLLQTSDQINDDLAQETDELNIIDQPPQINNQKNDLSLDNQNEPKTSVQPKDEIEKLMANNDLDSLLNNIVNSEHSKQNDKMFVIQLATLKNSKKIMELVSLLISHNYDVYTIPKIPQEGELNRLFVGPYLTKEQTDMVLTDLINITKISKPQVKEIQLK